MNGITLILPHQLFQNHPAIEKNRPILLVEDPLFFYDKQYPARFHSLKLKYQRKTMQEYKHYLEKKGFKVDLILAKTLEEGVESYKKLFKKIKIKNLQLADPVDYMVEKRLKRACEECKVELKFSPSPSFLNSEEMITSVYEHVDTFKFLPFYINQRKKFGVLIDSKMKPTGDKWTFDTDNRKKLPKDLPIPPFPKLQEIWIPTTFREARAWLADFIEKRFELFGPYEDAIDKNHPVLFHSVLSPMLNNGLLTPQEVLDSVLTTKKSIPINSLEGFIRQILGWREYIRAIYVCAGTQLRTSNFWNHQRSLPHSFYEGNTGIVPIDETIKKIQKYAYCHHIERLMVLGNFMLLCEIHPKEIYRWFMEMFIDAYDWVMVPNVYGMSQFAAGGIMTTKPYISSSNYICKMSNYPKGEWCEIWDGLFWRFFKKHEQFFSQQPRLGVLLNQLKKMSKKTLSTHIDAADKFLQNLE